MNFLAHATLSLHKDDILFGNMIADFVKGRLPLNNYPQEIREGILLHRKIDSFTDRHPAVLKAKNYFRLDYRLYSGAFVDIVFDHFHANDPHYFNHNEDLLHFTQHIYQVLQKNHHLLPTSSQYLFLVMQEENWLYNYKTFKGLKQGLRGVTRRAKYLENWENAFEISMNHYYELNQLYFEVMEALVLYVKKELKAF